MGGVQSDGRSWMFTYLDLLDAAWDGFGFRVLG